MGGLPQSRRVANDQSRVTISALAPALRARSTRCRIRSRVPTQYIWKNVLGWPPRRPRSTCSRTSSAPWPCPPAAAARATATSPSGCTACTPVGEMITGKEMSWPMTVVACSRFCGRSATCGRKPSSRKAATLSSTVMPCSEPATSAMYTDLGRRFLARRCASATVSNQCLLLAISFPFQLGQTWSFDVGSEGQSGALAAQPERAAALARGDAARLRRGVVPARLGRPHRVAIAVAVPAHPVLRRPHARTVVDVVRCQRGCGRRAPRGHCPWPWPGRFRGPWRWGRRVGALP